MDRNLASTLLFSVSLLLSVSVAGANVYQVASIEEGASPYQRFSEATVGETEIAEERTHATVFTAYRSENGHLIAINEDGTLWYYGDSYDEYYDVDPVDDHSVIVTAMDELSKQECPVDTTCSIEYILQINLTTGEESVFYERYRPGIRENEWHDVDRLSEDVFLVAGMAKERVFIVNTTTGIIDWAWDPQSHYDISTGGSAVFGLPGYPYDWTHLNDVERLDDGRIMVSMRNHDEVIFIDPSTGVEEDWTLGEDGDYSVLYEQHNPDFIPTERGGPAVIVADSHNNRIVEFQRVNDEWRESWTWADDDLQWPRDADRLPNGHTIVTDTNGARVVEVDRNGSVVWEVSRVPGVYDVERMGTGDESHTGKSAVALGLSGTVETEPDAMGTDTSTPTPTSTPGTLKGAIKSAVPPILLNSLLYVTPWWFSWLGLDGLGLFAAVGLAAAALRLRVPFTAIPVRLYRRVAAVVARLRDRLC